MESKFLKLLIFSGFIAFGDSLPLESRIAEGNEVNIWLAPYIVSLRYKSFANPKTPYSHLCGGTILSKDTIITAADCVEGNEPRNYVIVAGSSNTAGSDGTIIPIKSIIVHPNYDYYSIKFNVAILKLESDLDFNGFSKAAIRLAEFTPKTGNGVLSGYGKVSGNSLYQSEVLKQVHVSVVDQYLCRQIYAPDEISNDMFCAGNMNGNGDGCQGDAGSPLVINGELSGVLSFGRGCGRKDYPSVYTSIAHVWSWITQNL